MEPEAQPDAARQDESSEAAWLEQSWAGRERPIRGRELRIELWTTAIFLLLAGALALSAGVPDGFEPIAAAVVVAFAIAARVEFPIGAGFFVPTQLFLVPLFVVAPAEYVPLLVFGLRAGGGRGGRPGVDAVRPGRLQRRRLGARARSGAGVRRVRRRRRDRGERAADRGRVPRPARRGPALVKRPRHRHDAGPARRAPADHAADLVGRRDAGIGRSAGGDGGGRHAVADAGAAAAGAAAARAGRRSGAQDQHGA